MVVVLERTPRASPLRPRCVVVIDCCTLWLLGLGGRAPPASPGPAAHRLGRGRMPRLHLCILLCIRILGIVQYEVSQRVIGPLRLRLLLVLTASEVFLEELLQGFRQAIPILFITHLRKALTCRAAVVREVQVKVIDLLVAFTHGAKLLRAQRRRALAPHHLDDRLFGSLVLLQNILQRLPLASFAASASSLICGIRAKIAHVALCSSRRSFAFGSA
mmetsp:Transcript_1203/g.2848  ORF Transcript_1203/g.2848 Transcript_1203/m.2848 type:complete len:217 (+) Transcript_1203:172-822(+)